MEEWRFVKHDGKTVFNYQVSNMGQVKSLIGKGKIMKTRLNSWGYEIVNLKIGDEAKTKQVHRLVAEAFLGWRDPKWKVNHKDANKQNNCLENLEFVTDLQNINHAKMMGLLKTPSARLTDREKLAIKYLALENISYTVLATAFGVSRRTICAILNKKATDSRQA